MKALLCLLSDQPIPNLLSVHHLKPNRLVLVESEAMQKKGAAQNLLHALELDGLDYTNRCDPPVPLAAVDSLPAVRAALQKACDPLPDVEWIANVTGGTKPMSIAAHEFFKARDARIIYINFAKPEQLLDLEGDRPETCDHRLSIQEFLAAYGFGIAKAAEKVTQAEDRAKTWWPIARALAEHATGDDLLTFGDDKERDRAHKKGITLERRHGLRPNSPAHEVVRDGLQLQADDDTLVGKLDRYAAKFLCGGWLECFVWSLLDRHAEALDLRDVRLGIEPVKAGSKSRNEMDVALIRNYGLIMVECKTGKQDYGGAKDILYKVDSVIRQSRALGATPYLATTSDFASAFQQRADVLNCKILARGPIQALARDPDNRELVRNTFFPRESS